MIEIFIILLIVLIFYFMKKQTNIYDVAYDLGINFLNNIKIDDNYAVMFDIDDTLIFSKNGKPIKPMIKLLKQCNKKGIKVLIITARDSRYTQETIEELMENGIYPNPDNLEFSNIYNYIILPKNALFYDFIYLRHSPKDDNDLFKSVVKEKLFKGGIYTVLSVGDNDVDVIGDYSGYAIKLPNIRKDDSRYDPRLFHKDSSGRMVNVKV